MEDESSEQTDGGVLVEVTDDELYTVVRTAVRDAMLDVLGTVFLLVVALASLGIGSQFLLFEQSITGGVVGLAVIVFGVTVAAFALDVIPAIRE